MYAHEPLVWVLVSIVVYAAATNSEWWHGGARHASPDPSTPTRLPGPGAAYVLRACYLVAPPAAAIALRVTSPRAMGLAAPSSIPDAFKAVLAAVAAFGIAAVARLWFDRANGRRWSRPMGAPMLATLAWLALEAAMLETHWAFFRAATNPPNAPTGAGVFAALGLLAIEAWSNPFRRSAMADPDRVQSLSSAAVLAIASGLVFLASSSSILAFGLHLVAVSLIATLFPPNHGSASLADRSAVEPKPTVV